jgi:hypothetical protein
MEIVQIWDKRGADKRRRMTHIRVRPNPMSRNVNSYEGGHDASS